MSHAAAHLLTRQSHRRRTPTPIQALDDFVLDRGRVHEFCGPARRRLALSVAAALSGTILWIRPDWETGRLNPQGFQQFFDPSRLMIISLDRPNDLLWVMEEALRAGTVQLVIGDIPEPPGLTSVRRLQLAAEAGDICPTGLLLTPGDGGASGVETRWSLTPRHDVGGHEEWCLSRLRARMAPEKSWTVHAHRGRLTTASHSKKASMNHKTTILPPPKEFTAVAGQA